LKPSAGALSSPPTGKLGRGGAVRGSMVLVSTKPDAPGRSAVAPRHLQILTNGRGNRLGPGAIALPDPDQGPGHRRDKDQASRTEEQQEQQRNDQQH
jgi:hypothetical protein